MAGGEPFSESQLKDIKKSIAIAEKASGLKFGAFVGDLAEGRQSAADMLRGMPEPMVSVLVAVDPDARTVDVVTGPEARRWLPDDRCRLAILTMSSRFAYGDIAGGLRAGLVVLGEQAVHPTVLFTDEPA